MGRKALPKVVTSEGLTEFVQSGKHEKIAPLKQGESPPKLEVVKATPTLDVKTGEAPNPSPQADKTLTGDAARAPAAGEADETLTDDEKSLPDKAQKEILRSKRAVNEKHRQMREAQEAAEEADRLAEAQFNERRLHQQRADAAEAELKALREKANPPAPAPKEPVIEDYKLADGNYDWLKFQKDTSEYTRKQALEDFRKEQAERDAERAKAQRLEALKAEAVIVSQKYPDFAQVMDRQAKLKGTDADNVPRFVLDFIEESAHGVEIAYLLAKDPEVRDKISKMTPRMGTAELGVLQAGLVKPPSKTASPAADSVTTRTNGGAPAPITPVDGEGDGGHINTDPAKMSYKELRAYHKAQEAQEAQKRKH
jgi:hypothetical protein